MSDKQNADQGLISFINKSRRFLSLIGTPEWVVSAELTDAEHLEEMSSNLRITRERHELPERTVMSSVWSAETELTMAITGNTPSADERARFLTGLLTALPHLLEGIEASMVREAMMDGRIKELIQSNNDKLFENRNQRKTIRQLQAQVEHLLSTIPTNPEKSEQ